MAMDDFIKNEIKRIFKIKRGESLIKEGLVKV
jgi:hypothetical protein